MLTPAKHWHGCRQRSSPARWHCPQLGLTTAWVLVAMLALGCAHGDHQRALCSADAFTPARVERRSPPQYPPQARIDGVEGYVTLYIQVGNDGRVWDIDVLHASPPKVFNEAAIEAVRRWRFEPARCDGMDVAVRMRQKLRFRLTER